MAEVLARITRNVIGRCLPLWKLLLVGVVLLYAARLVSSGQLVDLGILVGGAWLVFLSYYQPMPAVFALMVLSTNVFMFVATVYLPHWQIAPGLRLTIMDSLLVAMFGSAVAKLYLRHERPLFMKPLLIYGGVVVLTLLLGLILGTTDLDTGMNCFRTLFSYVFYFILIASVDSPKRLRMLIGMVFVILAASVAIQIVEAALGHRLILGGFSDTSIYDNSTVIVEGQIIPYLWNRATLYLYIGLFLALGATFSKARSYRFLPIVLLGGIGFVIAMVRQWYLYILAGVLVLFVLQMGHKIRTAAMAIVALIGMLGVTYAMSSLSQATYGDSLMNIWIARVQTIWHYKETTLTPRAYTWQTQLSHFWQSPLFGYGMSPEFRNVWSSDTGVINTLLQFGLIGLAAVVVLIVTVFRKGYQLWRRLKPSLERGYVAGVLGLWVGMLVGYSFNWDFFTRQEGIWAVTLAMAILERIGSFNAQNGMVDRSKRAFPHT